jgi:hypothetical protein
MPVRAYSKASRFSSSPLAPTFQRHVLRDKHDEVGCLIVADKSQALQRCVMILRSRDSEEYAVASTGLLSATTKQRRRTVHARLSVVIATALALGSTSAVLAESNGDGGAFDAGSFHGVAWAVEVFGDGSDGGGFHRNGFQESGFSGFADPRGTGFDRFSHHHGGYDGDRYWHAGDCFPIEPGGCPR